MNKQIPNLSPEQAARLLGGKVIGEQTSATPEQQEIMKWQNKMNFIVGLAQGIFVQNLKLDGDAKSKSVGAFQCAAIFQQQLEEFIKDERTKFESRDKNQLEG